MRAKISKGIQEQNCRSHCSFRPLQFLSPFPSTQTHSFQPRTNSRPSWPTSHLHFHGPNCSPMQQPIFLFFFFFSFLSPTCPSLPPFFSHATSHPTSCNQPPSTLSPITFPSPLANQLPKHPAGSPLKTPPLAIKATKKEKKRVGHWVSKKGLAKIWF